MNPQPGNENGKIRITIDDLNAAAAVPADGRGYGQVAETPLAEAIEPSRSGGILMKAWCYLGLAGLAGALLAWAICEPSFDDNAIRGNWTNVLMFPLMLILMCAGFGLAESAVERSPRKAALRGALSLGIGSVLGFMFYGIANVIFQIGLAILAEQGVNSEESPAFWLTRAIAWAGFGVAGGVVYGIIGQSGKKCLYGIAGGILGAGLGGFLFDPIALALGGAEASRAIGMALFGAATGAGMGLVENALKDRWMYVSAGPLAGKQFILYKPVTTIGSDQSCDIYLFKDPGVQPTHAVIELHGPRAFVRAAGPVTLSGRPVKEAMLESGVSLQIGRYAFLYRDRERAGK